jgi:hypothetical protein
MSFYLLKAATVENYLVIEPPRGPDGEFKRYKLGESWRSLFGPGSHCVRGKMAGTSKKAGDLIASMSPVLVVGPKVRAILAKHDPSLEILPVDIVDAEKATLATDCAIINPTLMVDCVDLEASAVKRIGENIVSVKKLALLPDKIAASAMTFRLSAWPAKIVIREAAAKELQAADLVGLDLKPAQGYSGS